MKTEDIEVDESKKKMHENLKNFILKNNFSKEELKKLILDDINKILPNKDSYLTLGLDENGHLYQQVPSSSNESYTGKIPPELQETLDDLNKDIDEIVKEKNEFHNEKQNGENKESRFTLKKSIAVLSFICLCLSLVVIAAGGFYILSVMASVGSFWALGAVTESMIFGASIVKGGILASVITGVTSAISGIFFWKEEEAQLKENELDSNKRCEKIIDKFEEKLSTHKTKFQDIISEEYVEIEDLKTLILAKDKDLAIEILTKIEDDINNQSPPAPADLIKNIKKLEIDIRESRSSFDEDLDKVIADLKVMNIDLKIWIQNPSNRREEAQQTNR